jgi:hypothetical protein
LDHSFRTWTKFVFSFSFHQRLYMGA